MTSSSNSNKIGECPGSQPITDDQPCCCVDNSSCMVCYHSSSADIASLTIPGPVCDTKMKWEGVWRVFRTVTSVEVTPQINIVKATKGIWASVVHCNKNLNHTSITCKLSSQTWGWYRGSDPKIWSSKQVVFLYRWSLEQVQLYCQHWWSSCMIQILYICQTLKLNDFVSTNQLPDLRKTISYGRKSIQLREGFTGDHHKVGGWKLSHGFTQNILYMIMY